MSFNEMTELETSLKKRQIDLSKSTKKMLNKFLSYWQLEGETLKPMRTTQEILKNEICLYEENDIKWFELRSEKGYSSYKLIKRGSIVMTNKKLYFFSSDGVSKLTYGQISNIQILPDHVLIKKHKGKEPKLISKKDQVFFEIMMKKIWLAYLGQNWPS